MQVLCLFVLLLANFFAVHHVTLYNIYLLRTYTLVCRYKMLLEGVDLAAKVAGYLKVQKILQNTSKRAHGSTANFHYTSDHLLKNS